MRRVSINVVPLKRRDTTRPLVTITNHPRPRRPLRFCAHRYFSRVQPRELSARFDEIVIVVNQYVAGDPRRNRSRSPQGR